MLTWIAVVVPLLIVAYVLIWSLCVMAARCDRPDDETRLLDDQFPVLYDDALAELRDLETGR